jgi:Tol biopolymer transport system component
MQIKRMMIVSLWCLVIVSCSSQQITFTATRLPTPATPELTTEHISGWVAYSAVVSREPFVTQIFLKNLETDKITQLTNSENNSWARWSPDGSQIMFVSWTKKNLFEIYVMNKDGNNQRPIVSSSADELVPDWSPDGRKIAYVSNKDGGSNIYLLDLPTMNTTRLTSDSLEGFAPKWSPNGKEISFVSNSSENKRDGRSQVFIMNADGTDVRQMTPYDLDHFEDSPVWCPDSSCIIFMRFIGVPKLMSLDLASGEATQFIPGVFDEKTMETSLTRSFSRGYITFVAGEMYYAMDIKTKKIYSLGVKNAYDLSLYP